VRHPDGKDLRRFVEVDGGWELTAKKRGSKKRDHDHFVKRLPDGRMLRTRVSHGNTEIGDPKLFNDILKRQLEVSEEEFWLAVDKGTPPRRDSADPALEPDQQAPPAHQLEDWLAVQLAVHVGLSDTEIAALTPQEAMDAWLEWCQQQGPS
jgi:hypothetical protein